MTKRERVQHQVQIQSVQIEELFTQHNIPARVAGGRVKSRTITFDLQTELEAGWERLRSLKQELMLALGVPEVHIERYGSRWRLELRQPDEHAVDLLDLITAVPEIPSVTAVLGLADDHHPVLINLLAPDISHILIAGGASAGKSVLLRTMALSLALVSRQSELQLLVIDPQPAAPERSTDLLRPLNYLPHMLAPVINDPADAVELLNFLVDEIKYRSEQRVKTPTIAVFIDDVAALIDSGGRPFMDPLSILLQEGAAAGVRLVLSARNSGAPHLNRLLKALLSVRLVGQLQNTIEARSATGISNSRAEYLLGQGDFLAVSPGSLIHFQAAHIATYDLHLCLDRLHRQRPPAVLAQSFNVRPTLNTGAPTVGEFHYNSDNGEVAFDEQFEEESDG